MGPNSLLQPAEAKQQFQATEYYAYLSLLRHTRRWTGVTHQIEGESHMSLFGSIVSKIFGSSAPAVPQTGAPTFQVGSLRSSLPAMR